MGYSGVSPEFDNSENRKISLQDRLGFGNSISATRNGFNLMHSVYKAISVTRNGFILMHYVCKALSATRNGFISNGLCNASGIVSNIFVCFLVQRKTYDFLH